MWLEEKLKRSSNINAKFGLCCQSGKVVLSLFPHSPDYLDGLLKDHLFKDNIRSLNSMFYLTSMGGRCMNSFVQLYICDEENEVRNRLRVLRDGNSVNLTSIVEHDSGLNLHVRILHSRSNRQYIQPTSNEIAALIVGDYTNVAGCRDIIVCKNDGYLKRISETHPSYTPLKYPLLFPYGTDGWRIDILVIEFQKRELPHSHITLTLSDQDKSITPENIDEFICTEIPNKDIDPLAFATVVRCMIYGPCGPYNPNASCMVDGKCSKHYPKKCCDQTTLAYRRRYDPKNTVMINGVEIDNRRIVPYNRDLLVLFDAHINVEKCASPKLMKYMYKYMCKGIDRAIIVIENNIESPQNNDHRYKHVDEIKQYLDCCYVSTIESCWRIYEFELQKHSPAIERLQYYLPNQQFVVFREEDHLYNIVNRERIHNTMLTKWFDANKKYMEARSLLYVEFPTAWVWKRSTKDWVMRKHDKYIEIKDPVNLWERHWRAMVDDLQHRIRRDLTNNNIHLTDEELKDWALQEIE
ncbi:hypothetical protein Sango_0801700, partial [Sesamum angolense]